MKQVKEDLGDIFSEFSLYFPLHYFGPAPPTYAQVIKNQVGKKYVSIKKYICICAHWCHLKGMPPLGKGKLIALTFHINMRTSLGGHTANRHQVTSNHIKEISQQATGFVCLCLLFNGGWGSPTNKEWRVLKCYSLFLISSFGREHLRIYTSVFLHSFHKDYLISAFFSPISWVQWSLPIRGVLKLNILYFYGPLYWIIKRNFST